MKYEEKIREAFEMITLIGFFIILLLGISPLGYADDNHVHIDQVNGGDGLSINVDQVGYNNLIQFSTDHANNIFSFTQYGGNNTISWVPFWGSGYNWGGDVDGIGNNESVIQYDGATYGRHIWGNNNDVDVYQSGTHTHWLDIHASNVTHEVWQEGTGTHYSQIYYYGSTSSSTTDLFQSGSANHNAQITLYGNQPTFLNLQQLGTINQTYSLTQSCYTVGGCTVNVTQQ